MKKNGGRKSRETVSLIEDGPHIASPYVSSMVLTQRKCSYAFPNNIMQACTGENIKNTIPK
jgi:hypothetical protein